MFILNKKLLSRRIITLFFVVVFIFIALIGSGIYRLGWRGNFIQQISRLIPYPASVVDWELISYRTFLEELQTAERYWQAQSADRRMSFPAPEPDEIRRRLLEKLIEQKIIQIWARQHQLSVSQDELASEWEKFLKNPESKNEIDVFLNKIYGWNEEQFRDKVLAPWLLQEKVNLSLARAAGRDEPGTQARAEEIYQKIKPDGSNFAELAKAESDDKLSAAVGGVMGYVGQEQFEPQVAEAIFKLKIGQISKPLRSSAGYQIVKIEDLLYNNYRMPVKASLRQIFIKFFDFEGWLKQQKKAARIWRLLPMKVAD